MQQRAVLRSLSLAALLVCAIPLTARSSGEPRVSVLAISLADGRAIVREGQDSPRVRTVGDELLEGRYVLRALRASYVVLEEVDPASRDSTEFWVYEADPKGRSRVRRLDRSGGTPPRVEEQRTFTVPME